MRDHRRSTLILAPLLGGLLLALAAPPLGWWPLAWVALVPLWGLLAFRPFQDALLGAGLWVLVYSGITLHWIMGLHPLMWLGMSWGASVTIALSAWVLASLWCGLPVLFWMAILVALRPLKPERYTLISILGGTALWCTLDVLWSHGPLYSGSLAITQSLHNPWITQWAGVIGATGITGTIVLINGLLAWALGSALKPYPWGRSFLGLPPDQPSQFSYLNTSPKSTQTPLILAGVLFFTLHLGGAIRQHQSPPQHDRPPLTLGIIQGNIPTRIKLTPPGIQQAFKTYTQGYQALARLGVDGILLPEGAFPLVWTGSNRRQSSFYQALLREQVPALVSTFLPHDPSYSQSLISLTGNGEELGRYNKVKLVPLGEYVPLAKILKGVMRRLSLQDDSLTPGTLSQQFQTPWGLAAVTICYEPAFDYITQQQVKNGASFIVSSSNLDPYDRRLMAYQEAFQILRAVENDRWVISASNTGYSLLINPRGEVLWRSSPHQLVIQPLTLYPRHTQTPYTRFGSALPLLLWWSLTLGLILVRWYARSPVINR